MAQGYEYRKTLYQDYYANQSGRAFEQQIAEKMQRDELTFQTEIIPLLPSSKEAEILDIGCGFGSLILALKNKGYKNLRGIDLSESQIKVGRSFGMEELEVQEILSYLSSKVGQYDAIVGLDIIEHFGKDELIELLSLIKSALKPNGVAVFRTPNNDAPFATIYSRGDFTHENYLNKSSATQLMLSMGFKQVLVVSSFLKTAGFAKELVRKISWSAICLFYKWVIFASGRSSRTVLFSPNMVIKASL